MFSLCYLFLFFSCSEEIVDTDVPTQMDSSKFTDTIVDAHTLSNYKEVSIAHTHLDIEVDFNEKDSA